MAEDHFWEAGGFEVGAAFDGVAGLHDDHVAAIAALGEDTTGCCAWLEWCDDFDDVAAEGDC